MTETEAAIEKSKQDQGVFREQFFMMLEDLFKGDVAGANKWMVYFRMSYPVDSFVGYLTWMVPGFDPKKIREMMERSSG